jgi:hypothetical protein
MSAETKTRTLRMNSMFHGICEDAARSGFKWMGKPRAKDEWKVLFISGHAVATGEPTEVIGGLEGELVNIRESSARMSVQRGSSLIEYALAFCAMNRIPVRVPEYENV